MKLFLLGAGLGIVGGLVPSPLHLLSVAQVARWRRALLILIGPPLLIDVALLFLTLFFFHYVPQHIAHYVAYAGGILLLILGVISLIEMRQKSGALPAARAKVSYSSVIGASLAEVTSPGTWVYWLTLAGPILAEGRQTGYLHIAPFFAGSLVGYYGAAVLSVWLLSLGSKIHKSFNRLIELAANVLLLVLGAAYLLNAIFGRGL
ncbi:MAG: hypothetical protein ACRD1O_05600 [Terriglobia bacterium]